MNKHFRIGIDARLYDETGVGRYIRNLITNLAKLDSTNTYVLFLRQKTFDSIKVPGKNFLKVKTNTRWHLPWEQLVMPYYFLQAHLDLLHLPYQNFAPSLFYRNKFVLTVHDITIGTIKTGRMAQLPSLFSNLKQWSFSFLLSRSLTRACAVITVSKATKKQLLDSFQVEEKKVRVIYEAARLEKTSFPIKKTDNKFFLYVGSAPPHKNLHLLIRAFKQAQLPDYQLFLTGNDEAFYPQLKAYVIKEGLSEKVVFLGFVSDADLGELYQNARALVFPSLAEGFALPVLEAMANECLVIGSKIPAIEEIGGDAVLFFHPQNQDGLTKLLQSVVRHPEIYTKNIISGKKKATEFSWEETAKRTLAIYEDCLGLRSGQ